MFHVIDIKINLISISLLSYNIFKLVFESDKFVLSKIEMFIEKILSNGIWSV
jgi:hypothetical protein